MLSVLLASLFPFKISANYVTVLVSVVIPLIVGLMTKYTLPSGVKGLITLVLNAVNALVTSAVTMGSSMVISQATFNTWILGLVVSIGMYLGVYKNLGFTSSLVGGKLFPAKGIGPVVETTGRETKHIG